MNCRVKKILFFDVILILIFILNWINFQPIMDGFSKGGAIKFIFLILSFIWFWIKGERDIVLTVVFFIAILLNYAILKGRFFSYAKNGGVNLDFIILLPLLFYLSYRVKYYLKG